MTKWQYKTFARPMVSVQVANVSTVEPHGVETMQFEQFLDHLGWSGWEVFHVERLHVVARRPWEKEL